MLAGIWENIYVGLVGGLAVSGLMWFSARFRDWHLRRKFPVAGQYVTQFEDELADGVKVVATAPATLNQRGHKISGATTLDGREWILSGDLSTSGYIHGVYSAADPIDKGIGNFFLRVRNDRSMDGLWSGFDSVNGIITSGRYVFTPLLQGVTVRPANPSDTLSILRIADDQLGSGYVDQKSVASVEGTDGFSLVAEVAGEVVGFAFCLRLDRDEAVAMTRQAPPRYLQYADVAGVIKTVAVAKPLQGRGVGTALAKAAIERFRAERIRVLFSVAWKTDSGINIAGVLEGRGFSRVAEIARYWRDESIDSSFECPECGEPPCECSAVIYSHVLSSRV